MSVMWIPAQTTTPPRSTALSAAGTSSPAGANRKAASRGSGPGRLASPAHSAPSPSANSWASRSPARVKAKDAPALVARHLNDDVGSRTEAVEAEALGLAGHRERTVADEAGAEQRCRLIVRVTLRDREAVARIRHRLLRVL